MLSSSSAIRAYFAKLGLEPDIADIYLALHAIGPQSIAALARNSGIERTRIYRLIDKLMDSNLIEIETQSKRGVIKPAPIANLSILIKQREQELRSLQDELGLIEQVLARNSLSNTDSRVQFYQGDEGYRHMRTNEDAATHEILVALPDSVPASIKDNLLSWVPVAQASGKSYKIIVNSIPLPTIDDNAPHACRSIPADTFAITQGHVIYEDTIAHYSWPPNDFFGVEYTNKAAAAMQRQLYELLWAKAA